MAREQPSGIHNDIARVLYLADIRFPLERANGIQSMATCHALAARGHEVTLVVRPDSQTPPRDPFAFYGLPPLNPVEHTQAGADADHTGQAAAAKRADHPEHAQAAEHADKAGQGVLRIEVVPVTGPPAARPPGYATFPIGPPMRPAPPDLLFTPPPRLSALP